MRPIVVESWGKCAGHYAPGMISRGMLYISGQLPMDHDTGEMVTGDITAQTDMSLRNVEQVLNAAGAVREDVILCRVYIPDISLWDEVNRVYAAFFGAHKPARVMVPTRELHHGALVEIEAMVELED